MTTWELAESITGESDVREVFRKLLVFLVQRDDGYGATDPDREKARKYANRHGYFWLPCPMCKRWFGGHEFNEAVIMLTECRGTGVCPDCKAGAASVNEMFPNGILRCEAR